MREVIKNQNKIDKQFYIVVTPFFPTPTKFYGSYIYDQVIALKKLGLDVIVMMPTSFKGDLSTYQFNGITVYRFKSFHLPSYILNGITDTFNNMWFLQALQKVVDFDSIWAIHCHTLQCASYGYAIKGKNPTVKTIIQYHDLDPYTILNGRFSTHLWNLNYKIKKAVKKISSFDYNVSISRRTEENLLSFPKAGKHEKYEPYLNVISKIPYNIKGPNIKNSIILHNGVNQDLFRKMPKVDNVFFTVGCVANYIPLKNHKLLIDAMSILRMRGYKNLKLALVGTNPPKGFENVKNYIKELEIEDMVIFLPPSNHEDLPNVYNTFDLFVLPSKFEGFGCVCTEAFSVGVPFMSCYDQGICDLIPKDENDIWCFDPENASDLADKIEYYMIHRPSQTLTGPIEINELVSEFLNKITK